MRHNRDFPRALFYLLFIALFLIVLSWFGILNPLRRAIEKYIIIPAREEVFEWKRFFKKDLGECELRNEAKIAELEAKIISLTQENLAQKKLLSAPLPKNWQFINARVIGTEGETLIVDVGTADGIKEGMVAIFENTYLGKISSAAEKISRIKLASFFEEKLAVKIVSKEAKENILGMGLLVGKGEGEMKIEQILTEENVNKDDLVITNIEGGSLLVGKIEEVVSVKGEVFKSAKVKRLFAPETLNNVFIIRGRI